MHRSAETETVCQKAMTVVRRIRPRRRKAPLHTVIFVVAVSLGFCLGLVTTYIFFSHHVHLSTVRTDMYGIPLRSSGRSRSSKRQKNEGGGHRQQQRPHSNARQEEQAEEEVTEQERFSHINTKRTASTDQIVQYLMRLARMPTKDLRKMFEPKVHAYDPFHLQELRKGQCPWVIGTGLLEWLPERRPGQASEWFRSGRSSRPNGPKVAVYYEHLSKAGGTSFCKLAKSNMETQHVPKYYCMPSEENKPDARIGSWPLEKLRTYYKETSYTLMTNEWEPFQQDFLELQLPPDTDLTAGTKGDVYLMFLTTMRHPINRLLSAYKFFSLLNGLDAGDWEPPENANYDVKSSLEVWLQRHARRANKWKMSDKDYAANVGRFNFATWKFGGGVLPVTDVERDAKETLSNQTDGTLKETAAVLKSINDDEEVWRQSFETAIKTLIKFDMAMPMELLSEYTEPLNEMLGWTNFTLVHSVNMGKVVNNDASSELDPDLYDALWEGNKLDMILYYWISSVYLFRMHCFDDIDHGTE